MSELAPVAPRERVVTLDVLRGLALLGVLFGNIFWLYSARRWERVPEPARVDVIARWFVALFVQSKAQTLLTFLFGFGFAAQLLRAQERKTPVTGLYVRRLLALWALGALHVMLFWGDVTWTYAVAGFGLLLFQRTSNRTRLVWALLLTFIPPAIGALPAVRSATAGLIGSAENLKQATEAFLAALHGNHFWPVVRAHLRFTFIFQAPIFAWYYPWLLGHFLLGYFAGTQRWFDEEGARHLTLFRKLLGYGLLAALPGAALTIAHLLQVFKGRELSVTTELGMGLIEEISLLGLSGAYLALVVLLMQRPPWRRLLRVFAPVGRMPLTAYVAQSVICTALFYGWGLGWAGKVRGAGTLAIAIVVFTVEIIACHLWLRRFRFGPLEWVWRTLSYLRPPSMRAA